MRRLSTRLVASHVIVALIVGVTTFLVVRWLAPALFDQSLVQGGQGGPMQRGGGLGGPGLRSQVSTAVTNSLLVGTLAGFTAAVAFGAVAAWLVSRSVTALRTATRRIAQGDYAAEVPRESLTELADLADDVRSLGASLADTEARRVRLLGEVAHEMRTPLTVIDGYVEGMIDGVLPAGEAELGQVSDEVRRLRRLSDDLSTLSRAEENRLALEPSRVDCREVLRAGADRLRPQAADAGVAFTVTLPDRPVPVHADADRLAQVVTNLVGNALRATPSGGTVALSLTTEPGRARITVADTGEGLDADQLERIFERFYRVPGRRSVGADTGSGIGLTISRRIVEAHGGTLTASSAGRGRGATFSAVLPLAGS
ncbi:MAG TPA: HAMP domain-containing sensor histidine kinase [Propionibacteriaceae bacterium]|nr:HAMP domain-containing sensor histidine kinase [Propionibacteriaceae bacterium]